MSAFWIALLCVLVCGMVLAWLVRPTNALFGAEINITTQAILYGAVAVYMAHRAAGDVERGSAAAATVNGLVALLMFFLAALRAGALSVVLTGRLDENGERVRR